MRVHFGDGRLRCHHRGTREARTSDLSHQDFVTQLVPSHRRAAERHRSASRERQSLHKSPTRHVHCRNSFRPVDWELADSGVPQSTLPARRPYDRQETPGACSSYSVCRRRSLCEIDPICWKLPSCLESRELGAFRWDQSEPLLPSSRTFPARLRRSLLSLKQFRSAATSSFSARLLFRLRNDLLLVVLDYVDRARLRCVQILSDLPQFSSLAQQVPALIELNLQFLESLAILFAGGPKSSTPH